tara:strand:+ start:365 stop:1342 length:978 start_codon:yes stop_codon:yes gene_type:complete
MKIYKNKKILVTGGAGFIGSHFVKRIVNLGAKVTVTVKYNSIIDYPRLISVKDKIDIIECDLRNTDSLKIFSKKNFEKIFHFAAYNHVGDSFNHVTENISSNLLSTVNLLNSGPKFKKFIHIGSSEIYGFQSKIPFNPINTPNPMSPYAITKYASELFSIMNSKYSKKDILCLRPFNTFGPYQSEKAIIPEIILNCLQNKLIKTTQGLQTREFNYITNIIDGIILLDNKIKNRIDPINIGSNNPIKISELVRKIHKFTNSKSLLKIGALKYRPNEIWKMQANNKFILSKGWKPRNSLDMGLKETINWYKLFLKIYFNNLISLKNL